MAIDYSWEPPELREPRRSLWWVWVLVLIVVLIVVVIFVSQPSSPANVQTQQETSTPSTAPSTAPSAESSSAVLPVASAAPEMDTKCTVVAGLVPYLQHFDKETNTMTVVFKNNGKADIEGSYFEFGYKDKMLYKKYPDTVTPGNTITYEVRFNDIASELGLTGFSSFIIYPIQNSKACMNQRMIVFNEALS